MAHADALREMRDADALLLLQASNCNMQIPAKFYEYLRIGRPMLALTDAAGETARAARDVGIDAIAPLDDSAQIADVLARFMQQVHSAGTAPVHASVVASYSRRQRTAELASLFDQIRQGAVAAGVATKK